MNNSIFRDAYLVVSFSNLHVGDEVAVDSECGYVRNLDGSYAGDISCYLEDVNEVRETITQLRKDGVVTKLASDLVFVNAGLTDKLDIYSGTVVATVNDLAIVYVGLIEINENMEILDGIALVEDEVCYTLTDKGLKYLQSLGNSLYANDECVCPEEREENSTMDNLFGNLGFGKMTDTRFKLSMNGIAVAQGNGKYVVYNKDNNEFVDATNTIFDFKDALFLLPAVEVAAGDTVVHEGKPYFIVDTTDEIKAVSYEDCTQTVLIPKSTMFGIKYFTKVFSMFGDNFAVTGDLFSNPMMLMALMDNKNSDLSQLMLLTSLSKGDLGNNPMALAMLLKGDKSDNSLSTIALMSMFNNGTNPFAPKKKTSRTESAE